MSTALVFDRGVDSWRQHVKAAHYKLQMHASGAFLITPSLSAAMYLLAVRIFKRQYELAARLIPSVLSDVPFVGEESWVKGLFGGLSDDPHPDACALRLRIALQCTDCAELPPFGGGGDERAAQTLEELEGLRQHRLGVMRKEFDKYIFKWAAVSTACRLTLEQEERLVKLIGHPKRERFLDRLRKCESKPKHGHHLTRFAVSLMEAKVGGSVFSDIIRSLPQKFLNGKVWEACLKDGNAGLDPLEAKRTMAAAGSKVEPAYRYERPKEASCLPLPPFPRTSSSLRSASATSTSSDHRCASTARRRGGASSRCSTSSCARARSTAGSTYMI